MRIEFVIDIPGVHNPDAVDAVRVANEAVRLVRNDTGDQDATLVHVAVGSGIMVPRDYDEDAPIVNVEPTDIVHAPSAASPYAHPEVEHDVATNQLANAAAREEFDAAWDDAHAEPQPVDAEGNLIPTPDRAAAPKPKAKRAPRKPKA